MKTSSRPACARSSSSMASRFMDASSRMAECGQPPVSTPVTRSARQDALTDQKFGILAGVDVVGHHGEVHCRPEALAQHVNQSGFPAAHWSGDADSICAMSVIVGHDSNPKRSEKKISLRQRQNAGRLASQQFAVGVELRRFPDPLRCWAWPNCESYRPFRSCGNFAPVPAASSGPALLHSAAKRSEMNVTPVDCGAPPNDPNMGR